MHEVRQVEQSACATAWRVGCPITVNVKADGPIQPTVYDLNRSRIIAAAESAPVRACPTWPNTCPVRIIGDVMRDQYFSAPLF